MIHEKQKKLRKREVFMYGNNCKLEERPRMANVPLYKTKKHSKSTNLKESLKNERANLKGNNVSHNNC